MLSNQKRGWQGRSGGILHPTANTVRNGGRKRSSRSTHTSGAGAIVGHTVNDSLRVPANHSQFWQDWRRRCRTGDERRSYLCHIGPEQLLILFRLEMEPDLLAQILSIIGGEFPLQPTKQVVNAVLPASVPTEDHPCVRNSAKGTGDGANENPSSVETVRYWVDWLSALTQTGRFEINVQFLEKTEKRALARVFEHVIEVLAESSTEELGKIYLLQKAYGV